MGGSTSNRNGTCFTSSECSTRGGSSRGSCASGFGVCCVFTVSATSSTISNNDTYIQNPSFPSAYGETNSLAYTIQKCSDGKMIYYYLYNSEKWNYNLFPIRFASLSDIC